MDKSNKKFNKDEKQFAYQSNNSYRHIKYENQEDNYFEMQKYE